LLRVVDKAEYYSAFESTLNTPIVSYRIVHRLENGNLQKQFHGCLEC